MVSYLYTSRKIHQHPMAQIVLYIYFQNIQVVIPDFVQYGTSSPEGGTTRNNKIDKLLERMVTFKGYYVVRRQTN
jgi:hypothetical protein